MPTFAPTMTALESLGVRTLLGLRFWDAATDRQVIHDLSVTAWPQALTSRQVNAVRTASGNYALSGLPGLRAAEHLESDAPDAGSAPFVVQVRDRRRRFLDAVFTVALPLAYDGLYLVDAPESVPGSNPPGVYLFSAPWRSVPTGFAVIRALLEDEATGEPASWAVLEAEVGGETWRGIADADGQVAIILPWPLLEGTVSSSPPPGSQIPLAEQEWAVTVGVAYEPTALGFPPGSQDVPDLSTILAQQAGRVWAEDAGPPVATQEFSLSYGQGLVLRTDEQSVLKIDTGA